MTNKITKNETFAENSNLSQNNKKNILLKFSINTD